LNEECYNLYSSAEIIEVIKSVGRARSENWRNKQYIQNITSKKMKEGDNSGELREGRRIILKLTLKKHGVRIKTGLIWFRLESMGGSL